MRVLLLQCPGLAALLVGQDHELASGDGLEDVVGDELGGDRRAFQQFADLSLHGRRRPAERVEQVGLEERRAHHMHADLQRLEFGQQAFRQCNHAGLGDVVVAHSRALHQRSHGGDVDDASVAALEQRQERLAALDHTHQVDRQLPVPIFQRQLGEEAARGDPGVVDDDVDAAEFLFTGLRQCRQLAVITHVAAHGETIAAGLAHQAQGFGQPGVVDVRQRQPPALACPAQCQLAPQTGSGPRDHHAIAHAQPALLANERQPECSEGTGAPQPSSGC